MRKGVFAVAAVFTLALLALPLQAFAQQDARVITLQPEHSAGASQAAGDGLVTAQQDPDQATTPDQTTTPDDTTTTPDDTTTDDAPAPELEGDDDGVPQQYTDPLAGENNNAGGQEGQQQASPVATTPVVQSTASELPRTGDSLDILWIAGGLMVLAGLGLHRACRTREYPYSLPRY
jgi:LPXTG-motif cell wall-anchored protein